MAYAIVVTEGIVLGKRGVGEAHTIAALFTRELGLVHGRATSGRLAVSKLRYGLEPLTRARFSLVRGRNEWKIIGVDTISRDIACARTDGRRCAGRLCKLLQRLVTGEEPLARLYDTTAEGFALLAAARERVDIDNIECMLAVRTLWHLGYLPAIPLLTPFLSDTPLSVDLAFQAGSNRAALVRIINESLEATGL